MSWTIDIGGTPGQAFEHILQILNGHEEALLILGNTAAMRTLIGTDRDVTVDWGAYEVFAGRLTGAEYKRGYLKPYVYDKVHQAITKQALYSADYSAGEQANTIMTAMLAGTGLSLGECPTTSISLIFDRAMRYYIPFFIAQYLQKDIWSTLGTTFNIGQKGSCVLHLKMNEGAGGTAFDTSGMDNDGTIANASWGAGKFDGGLIFDGAGDVVSVADAPSLREVDTITFVLWFYKDALGRTDGLLSKYNAGVPGQYWIRIGADNKLYLDIPWVKGNVLISNGTLVVGWNHIILVKDGDDYSLYLDGDLDKEVTDAAVMVGVNAPLTIGADQGGALSCLGTLDEAQIINRALNAIEAKALFNLKILHLPDPREDPAFRGVDRSKQANHVLIIGIDADGNEITGEAYVDATTGHITKGTPGGGFSYQSRRYVDKTAKDAATLNTLAASYLEPESKETSATKIFAELADAYPLETGDYCAIDDNELNLHDVFRIVKRKITPGWVELYVDRAAYLIQDAIVDFSKYEDYGIYVSVGSIPKGSQGWNSDIVFSPGPDPHDDIAWTAGTIYFADSSTQNITTAASPITGLSTGVHYLYWVYGNSNVLETTTYSTAVGPNKGLLAKVTVSATPSVTITIETLFAVGTGFSHTDLADIGASDHHSKFTSGDHAAVDHVASMLKKGVQPFHSNVAFSPKTGALHNQVEWAAGVIKFADGGTLNINAGNTVSAIPNGEVRYIYFTIGSAVLTVTADYGDTIGNTVGILAVVGSSIDNNQEIYIQAFYSKGLNIIADVLAVNAVLGQHITATEWITAKNFRSAISPAARIEFNSTGIAGFSDATTLQFYILTADGKGYFAGGDIVLDEDGMILSADGKIIFKSSFAPGDNIMAKMYPYYVEPGNYGLIIKSFNSGDLQFEAGTTEIIMSHNGSIFLTTASQIYTRKLLPGQPGIDVGALVTPYDNIYGNKVFGAVYG